MRILYCISSLFNSAGMERIITAKANALSQMGHEVIIVTAEQRNRPVFFPLLSSVTHRDIAINYTENKGFFAKLVIYPFKRRKHEKAITKILLEVKPDICISTMGNEFLFLYKIKDGSKKLLEVHFSKGYRMMYQRSFLWRMIDFYRSKQEERKAAKYDKFVVLTHEDKQLWKGLNNITVIPNFVTLPAGDLRPLSIPKENILIAVGRLTYQKGFDRLVAACSLIKRELEGWKICIYGNGELKRELESQIKQNGLSDIIQIYPATDRIDLVYQQSKCLLFSSRFEGFGMVLIEALSYGVPSIAFSCPCGPRDVIQDNQNGLLVQDGDIVAFSRAIKKFISDESLQEKLSQGAKERARSFYQEDVMKQWNRLFEDLCK